MPTFFHVMLARIRGVFREATLDHEFDQELATHLAMAEADKMRRGMTRKQARRAARVELGGLTQLREASRATRGLPWFDTCWLDVKLALRMLRKSWGLTLVGGLAMTTAIAITVGLFSIHQTLFATTVPLDDGDRVVALMTWNATTNRRQGPSLRDFALWRDEPRSVENIGAFQTVERSLAIADGPAEPVSVAEMTASGFELARVPPLLGRPLLQDDERDGAMPVVVIGHEAWRTRFASDPGVVGQRVRLGATVHTVVGVMPEDFAFPVNHRFWTPLRTNLSDEARDEGPTIFAFARLAPGITLEGAEAELTTIGLLPSVTAPETDERLSPHVVPYALGIVSDEPGDDKLLTGLLLPIVALLLIPPCANIAILVYARTVTRQEEFAARYALGASRGRIVGQLFVEVLVLGAGAAGAALLVIRLVGEYAQDAFNLTNGTPFWFEFGVISFRTALFAAGLAVLAALIAGGVPALQATGRLVQSGLLGLGRRTTMPLGATWTLLVMAQVAFSIAVLPVAAELAWGTLRPSILGPGFAAEEFVTARLVLDQTTPASAETDPRPFTARFGDLQGELVRQLEAESDISAVTVSAAVPGQEPSAEVEIDGHSSSIRVAFNHVDTVLFDVFDVPLLIGRTFDVGDTESARTVIVNRTFAQQVMGDGNPLGQRIRYISTTTGPVSPSEPWHEIVGVVGDLPANTGRRTIYHPLASAQMHPLSLALKVEPGSAGVTGRLREMAAALDPTLRVEEVGRLDELYRGNQMGRYLGGLQLAAGTLSVLLLSAAGIYALMSFTVARRRREIGIRSALGAQPARLLAGIFKRALGQVAVGAAVGVLLALFLGAYLPIEAIGGWHVPGAIPAAAGIMVVIGLLAAVGPARRGLRVDPTEALRDG